MSDLTLSRLTLARRRERKTMRREVTSPNDLMNSLISVNWNMLSETDRDISVKKTTMQKVWVKIQM